MKKITKITDCQYQDAMKYIGYNLLENVEPKVVCKETGGHPEYKNWGGKYDSTAYKLITVPYTGDNEEHIDIFSEDFTMTYDLGKVLDIDGLFTSGLWLDGATGVYMLAEYELYVSENEEDLYTKKNLIAKVDNKAISLPGTPRQSEVFFKCEGVKGRYYGFKMLKACVTDQITRLSHLGVYNDRITEQHFFLDSIIENNYLTKEDIELPEGAKGCACSLVNNSVFDVEDAVVLSKGEVILTATKPAEYLTVTGMVEGITVYTADSKDTLWQNPASGEITLCDTNSNPESCFLYKFQTSKKYIGIKMNDGAVVEQLGLYTYSRVADADLDNIKTHDFLGIGGNDIPTAWMHESRMDGFRNVYWPIYVHRMVKSQPAVLRVWFQVDWVVTEEENYLQGKCNFMSDRVRAFIKYLDAYEKAGIEIELNFGWKASTEIQDWFSIPTAGSSERSYIGQASSAPRNFEGFAKCCAATVKHFCETLGYTCIKHLTFFNESNYGDEAEYNASDFGGYYGESKQMWEKMLRLVDKELKAIGADKYVDYWLAEQSGSDDTVCEWIDYMMENCREFNAVNTFHRYKMTYNSRLELFKKIKEHSGDVGALLGEFAVYSDPVWYRSNIEYFMSIIHGGMRGGNYWTYQGSVIADPNFMGFGDYDDPRCGWWGKPYNSFFVEHYPYHEFTLFSHYLPCHSKVIETAVYDEDTRIEVIETPDGNYSVFVESNESKFDKTINVNFSKAIGKTFTKHVYKEKDVTLDGNLRIPPVCAEIEVDSTLTDTIDSDYQLVCYTTIPAYRQVEITETRVKVGIGESYQLESRLLDCEGEIEWTVEHSQGAPCTVDQNGLVTTHPVSRPNDKHCIKATLKGHPETYAVSLIVIE